MPSPHQLRLGDCTIDLLSGQLQRGADVDRLSAKELACVSYLAKRPGQAVSRDELLEQVWRYDARVISRTVDATVRRLRKKIEVRPSSPVHLVTVHGAGYRLEGLSSPQEQATASSIRLLGREHLLQTLSGDLTPLRTLTGPPGIGKSALASALADQHSGTVLRADLSMAQPNLVDLRSLLGLRASPVETFSVLSSPLVLLDNAEAHIDALGPLLTSWLRDVPHLRLICTSRIPVGLPMEKIQTVEGLGPGDSIRLLGGSGVEFERLAEALEHNPLALTLAAEPCQLLGAGAVLERIRTHGDAFGVGQKSLDSAVETSWNLLPESQQRLLTLASLAPAALPVSFLEMWNGPGTLSAVQGLQRHALVHKRDTLAGPMLEVPFPVKPFALRMATGTDAVDFQAHLARWAAQQGQMFNTVRGEEVRVRLREMAPNLLFAGGQPGPNSEACLAWWSVAVEDTMVSLSIVDLLTEGLDGKPSTTPRLTYQLALLHWRMRRFEDVRRLAELGLTQSPDDELRLCLMGAQATAYLFSGNAPRAHQIDAEASELAVSKRQRLMWKDHRANRLLFVSDPHAIEAMEETWRDANQLGALRFVARTARQLAIVYSLHDDTKRAEAVVSTALERCETQRNWPYRGWLLQQAGSVAEHQGRAQHAEIFLEQAEAIWRAIGLPHRLNTAGLLRARITFLKGDVDAALSMLSDRLVLASSNGWKCPLALLARGMMRSYNGDYEHALRDLEQCDLRRRGELQHLRHCVRLLTLLRMGDSQAAALERQRVLVAALPYRTLHKDLADAAYDVLFGDVSARSIIDRHRDSRPKNAETLVLWRHIDALIGAAS